ncbi:MAG: peptidoglycan DD-metalloendopeptidase family protein [Anaerolineae bacterium]|nr:peptidoglycan DD-metalloendopeptidase family protein [Anaerolineae bacterium]MDQ7034301.1 peptidoglycan DD-metalloendopeptidase family protein [Anaerolineae bacterium]
MSSTINVPKPADAGSGQTAIVNTKRAYVNVRSGPGTNYRDIGDLRDNSLVVYYPNSKTSDAWYWMEYRGLSGWIAGSVAEFEATVGGTIEQAKTPYDGKVAVWHWKGDAVAETSIQELARNLKNRAPNLKAIWVKTSDGADWQGRFDRSDMAVNGPDDIDRWVSALAAEGLEFHAWCVPKGVDVDAETSIISAVCQRPGVKSMILDIEPYTGFWQGGSAGVRPFMLKIRQQVGGGFHIGMSIDPRPWHYNSVFPEEWFPFVNSIHPQCYWYTFRNTPEETLQQAYDTWGGYGRPVIPALQGDAPLIDQESAHTLATQRHAATGVSWWRYGVISQYGAVNLPIELSNPGNNPTDPTDNFADEVLIVPKGAGFRSGTYTGQQEFQEFAGTWNWSVLYKSTSVNTSAVWAEWKTTLPESGRYEISTFVPARHATTTKARYKVHGIKGTTTEVVIDINQYANRNRWVPLGIFELDKNQNNAGKVFLNDVTGETGKEIAFDAIRFRRIVTVPSTGGGSSGGSGGSSGGGSSSGGTGTTCPSVVNGVPVADGYDSPVGTIEQLDDAKVWPDGWLDASPFGRLYFVGTPSEAYHTGADLNWGSPYADKGLPTYACANGVVTFAGTLRVWGYVIIIRHDPLYDPSGQVLYSRYAHVQNLMVQAGDRVTRGQQVAEIGDGFGRFVPHLHFDLSPTTVLEIRPSDWPGTNQASLLKNYIDPLAWIRRNRP